MSRRLKVFFVVLILAIVALLAFSHTETTDCDKKTASTYSTGKNGTKALYLLLPELKYPVERFEKNLTKLKEPGIMLSCRPMLRGVMSKEAAAVKGWVEAGNTLVIANAPFATDPVCGFRGNIRGLDAVFGLTLESKGSGRSQINAVLPGFLNEFTISVSNAARWKKPRDKWQVIVEDEHGPVVVQRKFVRGKVIAVSDPTIFSNEHILDSQNYLFVLALLTGDKKRKKLFVDEYHHGHVTTETLTQYVNASVFALIFAQLAIGAFLFFYSRRARYAGRFRSLTEPRGRSSVEYVQSMANVLESCNANAAALEAIFNRYLHLLGRKTGIPIKMLKTGKNIGARGGIEIPAGLIRECKRSLTSETYPEYMLNLAQKMAAARRKLR
jgi:hypothetical protein